jgi:hypothetical protein
MSSDHAYVLLYPHAYDLIFTFHVSFFSSFLQHFFMDAEMKECVDPVTDEDVRCGAGTKGRHYFPFKHILQTAFFDGFCLLTHF